MDSKEGKMNPERDKKALILHFQSHNTLRMPYKRKYRKAERVKGRRKKKEKLKKTRKTFGKTNKSSYLCNANKK